MEVTKVCPICGKKTVITTGECTNCGGKACPLCKKEQHKLSVCSEWIKVPKELKELVRKIYDESKSVSLAEEELWRYLYKNFYQEGTVKAPWEWFDNEIGFPEVFEGGEYEDKVKFRIYINPQPKEIKWVWETISVLFTMKYTTRMGRDLELEQNVLTYCTTTVIQAKYCSDASVAENRRDSIVIFLPGPRTVEVFLRGMRMLKKKGALTDNMFRDAIPPGTMRVEGLVGVSKAFNPPGEKESFGTLLCKKLAKAFRKAQKGQLQSKDMYCASLLAFLKKDGVNIHKPWEKFSEPTEEHTLQLRTRKRGMKGRGKVGEKVSLL